MSVWPTSPRRMMPDALPYWWRGVLASVCLLGTLCAASGCSQPDADAGPWPRSLPDAQGLDGNRMVELVDRIGRGEYGSVHSLLIIRRHHLILEAYFQGYDRNDLHQLFSVTKSVTAALVGIALARGMIDSLGLPVMGFFPETDLKHWRDAWKRQMTIEHVLTMTAGLAWDELEAPYGNQRNPVMRLHASEDWMGYVLNLDAEAEPGTRFVYNSGSSMLLAEILRHATGHEAAIFAQETLFGPLGITDLEWTTGPRGITNTSWGLALRPIDMAKVGEMMLAGGRWDGVQVVPARWVRDALRPHVRGPNPFWYGYQWWMMPMELPGHSPDPADIVFARGWGGQFIILVPALELVVVSTGGNYRGRDDGALIFLQEEILSAVTEYTLH